MPASGSELTLAEAIRMAREARNLSKRALSLQAGLSESVVGKVESGTEPSLWVFARIVTALDLRDREVAWLVRLRAREQIITGK